MTEQGKTQIQILAAGFLGFAGMVGVGSLVIFHRGGAAATGVLSVYAPTEAAAALAVPASVAPESLPGSPTGQSGPVQSSPAPLLSDEIRADAPAVTDGAAAGAGTDSGAAAKLAAGAPLDAASSAASSAQASSDGVSAPKKLPPAKKPFRAPKLDLSKNRSALASTVHYGVSDRAELMGRAVGPVYNFSGKGEGGGQSAKVAAGSLDASGAMRQVDDAQEHLDSSNANGADKARVDQNLSQVRQAIGAPASSGQ